MRVLLATDAFPPVCGGSGWSTYELARGLRARGHEIHIVQPRPGTAAGERRRVYDEFAVIELGAPAPSVPYVRNYFKNERLHARLAAFLEQVITRERIDVVHGQHVLTGLPAIAAAAVRGIPSVCTVRDYWPVCYWSDLIYTRAGTSLCPGCSAGMMTQCVRPRAGAAWPLALPMIPYMRANLARKRQGLAAADAVIAVSSTIAADLRTRAPELAATRLLTIPNPVDVHGLRRRAAATTPPLDRPYALYLGKLAPNKGTDQLVGVIEASGLDWPVIVAGDGPDREAIAASAARAGLDLRLLGWVDQDAATAWLAHTDLLLFPSRGPESLSRVLIEASALGRPIAAMNTGGTPDIVEDEQTGLLSATAAEMAEDVRRLWRNADLRARLGAAAARRADEHFDASATTTRIERLYDELRRERG